MRFIFETKGIVYKKLRFYGFEKTVSDTKVPLANARVILYNNKENTRTHPKFERSTAPEKESTLCN